MSAVASYLRLAIWSLSERGVLSFDQARASLPQKVVSELIAEGLPVLDTYLSSSVVVRESHQRALPLIHLAPSHKLTREYVALHERLGATA